MLSEQAAAWVSAAASWVQAIGSVAAIVYSVRIARQADARAAAAEKDASQRAAAAEKAASLRAEAAERASELRHFQSISDQARKPLDLAIGIIDSIVAELEAKSMEHAGRVNGVWAYGSHNSDAVILGIELFPKLAQQAPTPEASLEIGSVHRRLISMRDHATTHRSSELYSLFSQRTDELTASSELLQQIRDELSNNERL